MNEEDLTFNDNFNIAVQKKFLSLLIFEKQWAILNGFDIIKPEYFENVGLQNICKWIHQHYKKFKSLPTKLILKEYVQNFINSSNANPNDYYTYERTLDEIFNLDDSENLDYYKDEVVKFARQISWKRALSKGSKILGSSANISEAIEEFKKVLTLGLEDDTGLDIQDLSSEHFLELLADSYDPAGMIKTGIKSWDEALGGGFVKKNVHIIGGAPGFGKSRIMAFLTRQALQDNKKVIFITLELSEVETVANIYTSVSGLSLHEMLRKERFLEFDKKTNDFKNAYRPNLVTKFFKPASINCDILNNFIAKTMQRKKEELGIEWKPDVIFLDYMDKLLPTQKVRGNSYEDMGGVATDCKNLAITFDCPVITGSQLGKYTWNLTGNEVISMNSIAESAQKVHICHSMTTINCNKAEKELGKARLYIAKSRSGTPGREVYVDNDLGHCALYEVEPWDPTTLVGLSSSTIRDSNTGGK